MENKYKVKGWTNSEEFQTLVAKRYGKLLKGGEPDLMIVAKSIIYDWQRGNIPFYHLPVGMTEEDIKHNEKDLEEQEVVPVLKEAEVGENK